MIEPETRENIADIIYDKKLTQENFKKHLSLSWSSFDNFQTCQGLWFINYFLKTPIDIVTPPIVKEHSRSIPGTLIQKMIEVFINERIYRRPDMNSLNSIIEWLQRNCISLYHLGTFPVEYQFKPDFIKTKNFWKNKYGKDQKEYVKQTYGMDDCIKEINISFVDKNKFSSIYGSEELFLSNILALFPKIMNLFVQEEFYLDRVLSEIYVKVPLKDFYLSGSIDFVYNPKQRDDTYFTTLTQLQNGYFLFDGKYNISSYTKKEQLFFYCYLLFLKTRKIPDRIALLNWKKSEFKNFEFDLQYKDKVESVLSSIQVEGKRIQSFLDNKQGDRGLFFLDNFVSLNPGENNCQFCTAINFCPAAKEKGIKEFSSAICEKIQAKYSAQKAILELSPSSNKNPDISL